MNLPIEYFLRASLVFALAFAVVRLLRRQPAALRHIVWVCAFGIAAVTPLFMTIGPKIQVERSAPEETFQAAPVSDAVVNVSTPAMPQASSARRLPLLESVWIAGMLLFGIRMWTAKRAARALLKGATVLDGAVGVADRTIRIAETDAVATAMTLGVIRPWILLPREHRSWEPDLLKAVLQHELAHVRRRDCLVQWLPNVLCAVHWFNPLVWIARSEMLCESERACDDAVIRSGVAGSTFARDLVEIAQSVQLKGNPSMSTALTTKLERRIARLLDPSAERSPLTASRAAIGIVLALVLLAPVAGVRAQQVERARAPLALPDAVSATKTAPRVVAQVAQTQIAQIQFTPSIPPAQSSTTGSLSGTVVDPSGAVVMGTTVRILGGSNAAAGGRGAQAPVSYSTTTGPEGKWSFSNLPSGTYAVEIQVPGFRTFSSAVAVGPGLNSQVAANLQIGRSTESVTIVADRPNSAAESAFLAGVQAHFRPIRVSAGVQPARLLRKVTPTYPQSARDQGVQGPVTLTAVIDKAGFVLGAMVVSRESPPELAQAAIDAVKQWQYQPTMLNGEPVEVVTEITVNFTLQ